MVQKSLIHGTCLQYKNVGLLLQGKSGIGKSDLTLRLIDNGGTLVSDDQVCLSHSNNILYAYPPEEIEGKIEIRGIGIVKMPYLKQTQVDCTIQLDDQQNIERLPFEQTIELCGHKVKQYHIDPKSQSAIAKINTIIKLMEGYYAENF